MIFISIVFVVEECGGTLLSRMDLTRTHFSSIDCSFTGMQQQPGRLELGHPKNLTFFFFSTISRVFLLFPVIVLLDKTNVLEPRVTN